MSYRTYINGHEWLGNNVRYYEIFDELARQGCPFDEDDCVDEPFEVKDLDGLVKACEKTIIRLIQENNEVANFKPNIERAMETNDLTFILQMLQDCACIFMSVNLLKYIGDKYKDWDIDYIDTETGVIMKYKLTDKGKCLFEAY